MEGRLEGRATPVGHAVTFYDHDRDLVGTVVDHLVEGLLGGESALVVATGPHREMFHEGLDAAGIDVEAARAAGRYFDLDAAELLAALLADGIPDPDLFDAHVGAVVSRAATHGSGVRIFGEMVALLWAEGNVLAALALEDHWNDLAARLRFSLLCAYPIPALVGSALADVEQACGLHSRLTPPSRYGSALPAEPAGGPSADDSGQACAEVFLPATGAIAAARRFVAGVLSRRGADEDLLDDAALVVSELATNAVRHGRSPFRVVVSGTGSVVRIEVEDAGPGWPRQRTPAADDPTGRGVAIVAALSRRSGCDALPDGKVAWVDLR